MTNSVLGPTVTQVESRRANIHQMLQKILQLAPTCQSQLFPILQDHFPHKRFEVTVQTEYISQLLRICEYVPIIQYQVLDLIVGKCLELDVEIVIEDSGDVKILQEQNGEDDDMFLFDDIASTSNKVTTFQPNPRRALSDGTQRIPHDVIDVADKLDAMLMILIQYIDSKTDSVKSPMSSTTIPFSFTPQSLDVNITEQISPSNSSSVADQLFSQLLSIFEHRVLSTHKSKFVQFLIFHLVSKRSSYADCFVDRLLEIFLDETCSPIRRQSAVLYLSSFVSRALFLSVDRTRYEIYASHQSGNNVV